MKISNLPKQAAVSLINFYQAALSPDHSWLKGRFPVGFCRHFPSCSQYAKEAILKFGVFKGIWLAGGRIVRCNPWTKPKIDLIPN
jgi:putative membrane protein insertion efficiency factor